MSERLPGHGVENDDLSLPEPTQEVFRWWLLHHLQFTVGKDPDHASKTDWRLALTHTIRDRALTPWFASTRRTWAEDRKRVVVRASGSNADSASAHSWNLPSRSVK